MAIKKKKFYRLRSDSLHTFNIKAWSADGVSAWTDDILIKTSAILPIAWPSTAKMRAKPAYFTRSIKVRWTALVGYPLRFSHYVLFRKDTTAELVGSVPSYPDAYKDPSQTAVPYSEVIASGQDIVNESLGRESEVDDPNYFLKEMGRINFYYDRVSLDSIDEDDDEGLPTGLLESGHVEKEHQYHYWVWGVDNNGQLSYSYLLDNAEFGKPNVPTLINEDPRMETDVHDRIKWLCDVKVVWDCVDGAESYWVQRKLHTEPPFPQRLWGLPTYVEHNVDTGDEQSVVLQNFFSNKKYDFRVKAVNVPVFLVSAWSESAYYTTDKDPYPPDEIESVDAKRLRQNLIRRGEYIKLTWDWPTAAIMQQQVDYYRIYRIDGTITQAEAYLTTILAGTATPYTETKKFGGTHFVDDDIVELADIGGAETQSFFWNGDYGAGSADDKKTAYIDEDLNTEVGTISGFASVANGLAYDGTYSLLCAAQGDALYFSNVSSSLDGDIGSMSFRFYPVNVDFTATNTGLVEVTNRFGEHVRVQVRAGKMWVEHEGAGAEKELTHSKTFTAADWAQWHHIEVRWKVSTDTLQMRVNDGDWETSTDPTTMLSFGHALEGVTIGPDTASAGDKIMRLDKVIISFDYEPGASAYYHYWVTAVDIDEQESLASMGESYDRVSFGRPDAPTPVSPLDSNDDGFNMVLVLGYKLFTVKMVWRSISEATYYRVKIKIQSPERDPGPWMYTARIPEAKVNTDDDGNPFFVYPFPLRKDTEITWAVAAGNLAGETESDEIGPMAIIQDTEGPSKANTPVGECLGINTLFPPTPFRWMVVILRWKPNDNYEGVESYIIYEDGEEVGRVRHSKLKGGPIKGWMIYHHFDAAPSTTRNGTHIYKVQAAGYEDEEFGEESEPVTVKWEPWWVL